jgi:membrane protein
MIRTPDPYGRDAGHPLEISLRGWLQVVHRVSTESIRDNLSVIAAGCAFFAVFALFPALSALFLLYGLTVDPAAIEPQFGVLALVLPPQAYQMIVQETKLIAETSGNAFSWSFGLESWVGAMERSGTGPDRLRRP